MPLYVDDEVFLARFTNMAVVYGLRFIKAAASASAVTPALAQQLIRCYLRPLASTEGRAVFDKEKKAGWDSIYFLYGGLGFCAQHDDKLQQVACAVKLVHAHTKQPPRDLEFVPIEVNTFLQHCGYLHLPIEDIRFPMGNRNIDPLLFCELCWRQPLPGRKLCGHHAPSDPMLSGNDRRKAATRYKAGMRQKELLEKTINRILTHEVLKFHEGQLQDQMLFPDQDISSWLAERRPTVWRELGCVQRDVTDENVVQMLLGFLHNPEGLPVKAQALYRIVNEHIRSHPVLIWPMLLRAEGWYQSRELMERNRGGKRPGAGRPKQAKK
ncbi:hypothetical protein LH447_13855 [Laribacter hongkongensis]|uniref:hypothetical protein n=1 Tax=Laribacter hongkongensis TaxID=168471 RepID=UPI001EFD06BC|nr:hypothetical protein [Laribacter hongkongensis]MCG9054155.1 hypothetical protein [Laribacter hongkongensis]